MAKKKPPALSRRTKPTLSEPPRPTPTVESVGDPILSKMEVLMSSSVGKLAEAIYKVQRSIGLIGKDSEGFKYAYTSLGAIRDAIEGPLAEAKLVLSQFPCSVGGRVGATTVLIHAGSGEWMQLGFTLPVVQMRSREGRDTATLTQCAGAAITYAKRYAICSVLGIVATDDADVDDFGPGD